MATYKDFNWEVASSVEACLGMTESGVEAVECDGVDFTRGKVSEVVDERIQALRISKKCKALYLNNNKIGNFGTQQLMRKLSPQNMLVYLYLGSNGISRSGGEAIAEFLKADSTMIYLYLGENCIGDLAASAIGESLKVNSILVELNLWDNNIGEIGACALAEGLKVNNSLHHFDIGKNKLGDNGAIAYARALALNTGLICTNIGSNDIGDVGMNAITEGVKCNTTITAVHSLGNPGSTTAMKKYLQRNANTQKQAFLSALKKNGQKAPWRRSKLMIVGHGKAGKTATARSLLGQPFVSSWESTIGVQLTQTKTKTNRTGWAMASEDENNAVELAARVAVTNLFQNDVAQKRNGDSASSHDDESDSLQQSPKKQKLITPPLDLKPPPLKRVETDESKYLKPDIQQYTETLLVQAKKERNCLNFCIWDYGGQEVFYTMHHLFLTQYGVYLLVFNMQELLNDGPKCLENLKFWLLSIRIHAQEAPVIIVGTFFDMISNQDQLILINDCLKSLVGNDFSQVVRNQQNDSVFFALDNRTGSGIETIRSMIERVTTHQKYVNRHVSVRWMHCLDAMLKQRNKSHLSLDEVKEIAMSKLVTSSDEFDEMMHMFHELGLLIHLKSTETLRNVVITNPQWLIDQITKVIRDPVVHKFDNFDSEITEREMASDVQNLTNNGIASRDLLEYLWRKQNVPFLLEIMRETLLLSDWNFENVSKNMYLVPSLNRDVDNIGLSEVGICKANGRKCLLDFSETFLPVGVFQRLVTLFVAFSGNIGNSPEPSLGYRDCKIWLGRKGFVRLCNIPSKIFMIVEEENIASNSLSVLLSMLRRLNEGLLKTKLKWKISLEVDGSYVPYSVAKQGNVKPWFEFSDKSDVDDILSSKALGKTVDLNGFFEYLKARRVVS
eukprot:CAMPEP_0204865848 /NCGR_PEP_ID=MMETSP1348-20121228/13985_1 /ASSEMBLY_ACC=CAM_ASM_000700 /TAXON_ID=215587 /ORGANISM="Aplanochytrium stocchinoi, Strain GSBS06" /LENGTH=897 /DNA_ID=CAMNT_0052017413 /DNA_START=111 /DNA_END=2804 /DNA_ORIENTATION=+